MGYRHHRGCHHHRRARFAKNADKARDPDMHQTQRPAMVFPRCTLAWTAKAGWRTAPWVTTACDKHPLPNLLHGNERRGVRRRCQPGPIASASPKAKDFTNQRTRRQARWTKLAKNRNKSRGPGSSTFFAVVKRLWAGALPRAAKERHVHGPGTGQHLPCRLKGSKANRPWGKAQYLAGHLAFKWLCDGYDACSALP